MALIREGELAIFRGLPKDNRRILTARVQSSFQTGVTVHVAGGLRWLRHAELLYTDVGKTADMIKLEIRADMIAGTVPESVRSFSELHDYVDANAYGGFCDDVIFDALIVKFGGCADDEFDTNADYDLPVPMWEFMDDVQNDVNVWLAAGSP